VWLLPPTLALWAVILLITLHHALSAVAGCAFNGWVRDLVPDRIMGKFFSRQMSRALLAAAVFSVLAGVLIDTWEWAYGSATLAYTVAMVAAAVAGAVSLGGMVTMPEPEMDKKDQDDRPLKLLQQAWSDPPFRRALMSLGTWTLLIGAAGPFYAVYLLERLELPLTAVMVFGLVQRGGNVISLPAWGRIGDRFGHHLVLVLAAPILALALVGWPLTSTPAGLWLAIPLLVVIELLVGAAQAGIDLGKQNLAMERSPEGDAAGHLACSELVAGTGGLIGPLLGGGLAMIFANVQVGGKDDTSLISLYGLDWLFFTAAVGAILIGVAVAVREGLHSESTDTLNAARAFADRVRSEVSSASESSREAIETARRKRAELSHQNRSTWQWLMMLIAIARSEGRSRQNQFSRVARDFYRSWSRRLPPKEELMNLARTEGWRLWRFLLTGRNVTDWKRIHQQQPPGKGTSGSPAPSSPPQ
ncbi:MAG: MFS transporter, partial [Phycisphaeraceae bacterium]|nr:MFS transporter [Phycisphaeraceae bacterium]